MRASESSRRWRPGEIIRTSEFWSLTPGVEKPDGRDRGALEKSVAGYIESK